MPRLAATAAAVLLAAAGVAPVGACRTLSTPPRARAVVLVSVDTLRADRLGVYGHEPSITPHMDAFSRDAVLFKWAIAQAPSTLPSHASLFTSSIPQHHGASVAANTALPAERLTVAEALRDGGFRTVAFQGGGQLDPAFGMDQGFQHYQEETEAFAVAVDKALHWLGQRHLTRFFLFLHTYEAHHPYLPSPGDLAALDADYHGNLPPQISLELLESINANKQSPLSAADLRHIEHAYDAGVLSVDRGFGALLRGLKQLGLYNSTLIVLTSDHGEEFAEHGMVGMHGHTLFDELLHVPLVVKYPQSWHGGEVLDAQVRGIDVAPTVLGAVGLAAPPAFEGADLTRYAGGASPPPPYAVSALDGGGSSLRSERWKWDRGALYDLREDPAERFNVARSHAAVAEKLRAARDLLAGRPAAKADPAGTDPELRERLKSLGYVQ